MTKQHPATKWLFGLIFLALAGSLSACDQPPSQATDRAAETARAQLAGDPRTQAVYVTMPDGVRIAVDVWIPPGRKAGERLPAMMQSTRYWRDAEFDVDHSNNQKAAEVYNGAGYVYVIVDTRGSGASFGTRATEFSLAETRDFYDVIDWIAKQPWSNGRVVTNGVSYDGNTAENAALVAHPALKVAVPRFTDFDWYTSLVFPGGLRNRLIAERWGAGVAMLDANDVEGLGMNAEAGDGPRVIGVKPVDDDVDRALLHRAIAEHAGNTDVTKWLAGIDFRNDSVNATAMDGDGAASVSIYNFRKRYERIKLPMYHMGSWMDAGTAAGLLARFVSFDTPYKYVIGAWSHGGGFDADPFNPMDTPAAPDRMGQFADIFAFLKPYMFGDGETPAPKKEIRYYTMGEKAWKTTDVWPPAGSGSLTLYFAAGGLLSDQAPAIEADNEADNEAAGDEYKVNFEATSGANSRWMTQLGGGDVFYGDRAGADKLLLTYTSRPLEEDLEITGHPLVSLALASSHEDGAVIAYLELVDRDGKVTMITEGELRLVNRKVSRETPPFEPFGPYHTFRREDAIPMVPGEVARVEFAMLPTSVLVPKGYAIRIAIAGHDKDTFVRYPAQGDPTLTIHRGGANASRVVLPVVARD